MRKKYVAILLAYMAVFSFVVGFSNRKPNLYENMVNASVLIRNDYGFGSGVFIYDNVIVTAAHVLKYSNLTVELVDGIILSSNDFYIDEQEDVGFIFLEADELSIARVSTSPGDIGDTVYLVGTPYNINLKFTITKGILSHLGRDYYQWEDLLQTDAEGAHGSSGGPLYDSQGNVIGICVGGPINGGGVTLCESGKSILEAYERCMNARGE
jgi:S1-C subfamily serine protease